MAVRLDASRDNDTVRSSAWNSSPELQPFKAEYWDLTERLRLLKRDEVAEVFGAPLSTVTAAQRLGYDVKERSGPKLTPKPDDLILPVFASTRIELSGLHSEHPSRDKNHTDLHAIDDIGYVECYYQNDGDRIEKVAVYFRADRAFVPLTFAPLKSTDQFN